MIPTIALSPLSVLVLGETGVGNEALIRRIEAYGIGRPRAPS